MYLTAVAASDEYKTYVVFHGSGYTVYDPALCRAIRLVSAQFDLATRRSTRLQLTSGSGGTTRTSNSSSSSRLCDVTCDWSDAVVVGNKFIYVAQPSHQRLIVIDVTDSHSPVEVSDRRTSTDHFCRAVLRPRAVSTCLSIRSLRSCTQSKRVNIVQFFSPLGSYTILVFPH